MLMSHTDMNALSLNSKLIGAYASCGDLGSAELVFQRTTNLNIFAFNWMISALAFHGYPEKSIGYFSLLQQSRTIPNKYTFSVVLKACVGLMDLNKEKEVQKLSVANALIDMYGKCGNTEYAHLVFNLMVKRDIVSWTSMIYSYANMGKIEESFILFEKMRLDGIRPNDFTWNVMITGYARRVDCGTASMLFSKMSIEGFIQSHRSTEALSLLLDMLDAGVKPNEVTLTGLLPGEEIHGLVNRLELIANVFVASALIDMYSRCGREEDAWKVFSSVPFKNVASWNCMIGCYGKHGRFYEGVLPNGVTLTSLLSASSHGGLVEKGMQIFWSMEEPYGISARKEHYACGIDLLCRVGRLEEASDIIKDMPIEVTDSVIGDVFSGCKVYARRDLGEKMAKDMDLKKPEGEWENVENVRNAMKDKGLNKMPGSSWL
ncbi:unnamed protein product [Withania somnifera]